MDSSKITGPAQAREQYAEGNGLPKTYGDTKIVALPRDPLCFYAYWEVSAETWKKLRERLGVNRLNASRWILRVYDVTGISFNGSNANKYFDIVISSGADKLYVNVGDANRSWCVDIGVNTPDGEFIVVASSNILAMPRKGVSTITDEQWAILQSEFENILQLSGVDRIGKNSFDIAKQMKARWEEIVSFSLPSSHFEASSWKGAPGQTGPKEFWLKADTEIIVYGATEPDAKLTVQGQPVTLRSDGSFTLRFYLPDGSQEYPIEAISSDGTMQRKITFTVNRSASSEGFNEADVKVLSYSGIQGYVEHRD